jgi:hypothetical protein
VEEGTIAPGPSQDHHTRERRMRERESEEPVVACGEDKNAYSTTLDERQREKRRDLLKESTRSTCEPFRAAD